MKNAVMKMRPVPEQRIQKHGRIQAGRAPCAADRSGTTPATGRHLLVPHTLLSISATRWHRWQWKQRQTSITN